MQLNNQNSVQNLYAMLRVNKSVLFILLVLVAIDVENYAMRLFSSLMEPLPFVICCVSEYLHVKPPTTESVKSSVLLCTEVNLFIIPLYLSVHWA